MGNPFKTHSNPIQNPWGTHSKSMGSPFKRHGKSIQNQRGRPKFYSFKLSIVLRPNTPQTEIRSPMPFPRPLGYPLPNPSIRIRIPLHPGGTLMWKHRRVKRSALGEPLSATAPEGEEVRVAEGDVPSRAAVEELSQPTGRLPPLKF